MNLNTEEILRKIYDLISSNRSHRSETPSSQIL